MGEVTIRYHVTRPLLAFRDREHAGRELVDFMRPNRQPDSVVLGLPRGGVAVGAPLAAALRATLYPLVVRKLPIPASPEMGFGAVGVDGTRVLNHRAIASFGLTDRVIDSVTDEVMEEVRRRAWAYTGSYELPDIEGHNVYIVDDGLATGFTAMVGGRTARRRDPTSLTLAVPVSPVGSIRAVQDLFDEVHCLYAQECFSFAVASYYRDFHDMTDSEVMRYLEARGSPAPGAGPG